MGLQQGEADIGELMVQLLFLGIFAFGVVRFVRYVSGHSGERLMSQSLTPNLSLSSSHQLRQPASNSVHVGCTT